MAHLDNEILLALIEAWEAQTERLRKRRLGSDKKLIIQERERVAGIARATLAKELEAEEYAIRVLTRHKLKNHH